MTYQDDIVSKIKQKYSGLSTAEQFVADLILTELDFVASASITQIAQRAKVSEATVIRFSKTVGCKGLRHLKENLIRALAIGERFILESDIHYNIDNSVSVIFNDIYSALNKIMQQVDIDQIKEAAQFIDQAKQVIVFGTGGGSSVIAQDAQYRLFRFGIPITTYHDAMLQRMVASTLNEESILLVFSASGEVDTLIEATTIAKQYAAKIITVTPQNSSLAQCSDISLHVKTEETDLIFKSSASRYALLAMLDLLCFEVALCRKDLAKEFLRRIKFNLNANQVTRDLTDSRYPVGD